MTLAEPTLESRLSTLPFITGSSRWANADIFEAWALRQGASKQRFVDARAIIDAGKVVIIAEDARGLVTGTAIGALPPWRQPPPSSRRVLTSAAAEVLS